MCCEEYQMPLWKAGEVVPAGTYVRIDDGSYRLVTLDREGPLPPSFDAHIALYCVCGCACRKRANCQLDSSGTGKPLQPTERETRTIDH